MSDPIKAALREAIEDAMVSVLSKDEAERVGRTTLMILANEVAIAAVAAFLRALPDPASPEGFEAYRSLGHGECFRLWLADAVERAAREAGNER